MGVRKSPAQLSSTNFPSNCPRLIRSSGQGVSLGFELRRIRFGAGGRSHRALSHTKLYTVVISTGFETVGTQDGHSITRKN